jgi:ADP-ribose pyrophosphatase YjhB (NUDIX family)
MEQIPNCFYRISAKALILDNQKKFLLVKEDNGLRELPWWWLDFWENPQEWISRELLEEMWINIKSVSQIPSYFITSTNLRGVWISNIIYETQVDTNDIYNFKPSEECLEVRFFTVAEAEKEQLFPNVVEFIKQYNLATH